jgi:hypothetical protein
MTQGSKIVSELIGQVKSKYQELKVYRPFTTDLAVLQERHELDQIYTFLDALDLSYDSNPSTDSQQHGAINICRCNGPYPARGVTTSCDERL